MPDLTHEEFWAAGIIEGEGTIDLANGITPRIRVTMTDLDVMIRLATVLVAHSVVKMSRLTANNKQAYYIAIHGESAVRWMNAFRPIMGERRKIAIDKCLDLWAQKQLWTGRRRQRPKEGPRLSSPNSVWINPVSPLVRKEVCHS